MALIEFSLVSDTDTIPLGTDITVDSTFQLMKGSAGLGLPPRVPRFQSGAGDGGTFMGSKAGMRDSTLLIRVGGTDRADLEVNVERLAAVLDPERRQARARIVAEYSTGEAFEMPFVYLSGLEDSYTEAGSDEQDTYPISVRVPKPYWTARDAEQFVVQSDTSATDLLEDLAGLPLGSSTAFGELTVDNPGNYESIVDWYIAGPGGPITAMIDGQGFVLDVVLEEGDVRTVDGATLRVLDGDGNDCYGELGPVPRFPLLDAGRSLVFIQMDDATSDSIVAGRYKPRKKMIR